MIVYVHLGRSEVFDTEGAAQEAIYGCIASIHGMLTSIYGILTSIYRIFTPSRPFMPFMEYLRPFTAPCFAGRAEVPEAEGAAQEAIYEFIASIYGIRTSIDGFLVSFYVHLRNPYVHVQDVPKFLKPKEQRKKEASAKFFFNTIDTDHSGELTRYELKVRE